MTCAASTRRLGRLMVLVAAVTAVSCRRGPTPGEPSPPPVHHLCLKASPDLNWYDRSAHTLYVRMFQLSALDAFDQTDPGRLLDPQVTLPGVEGAPLERTVYPGTTVTVDIQQKPDAQYVGVVAGYYRVTGAPKLHVALQRAGDESRAAKAAKPACIQLGSNGMEAP